MAGGIKTSNEAAAAALAAADLFRIVQSGANAKATMQQIKDFIYSEGTFTPTLGDGTNNYTLTTAVGYYIKIGRLVFASFYCIWSSIGSAGAGQLRMGALPFTSQNVGNDRFGAALSSISGFDLTATLNPIVAQTGGNQTIISFSRLNDNAAPTALPANGSSATGEVAGSIVYIAAP